MFNTLKESLILKERQLNLKKREYDGFIESRKKNIEFLDNMEKLDRKLALQIASEILKKKRNEIYKIKMKS